MRNLSSNAMSVYHKPTNHQASVHQRSFDSALWWQHLLTLFLLTCFVMVPLSEAVGYSYTRFVGPVRGPEIEFVTDDPITGSQHLDYIAKPEYEFSYGVEDAEARILHNRNEVRDGDEVKGVYSLVDPDGTLRIVKYTADGINGFQAEVITNGLSTLHGHHHPLNGSPSAAAGSITTPTPYQPGGFRPSLPTFVSPSYVYQKQQQLLQQQQSQIPGIITTKLTPPGSELQPPHQYNQHGTAGVPTANNNNNNDAKDQKPNYKVHESQEEGTNETEGDDSEDNDDDDDDSHEEADKEDKKKNYQDTEEEEDDDDYEEEVEDYEEKVKKTHATYDESDEDYYRK